METFKIKLDKKLTESKKNNFGKENFDEFRFGRYTDYKYGKYNPKASIHKKTIFFIKAFIKWLTRYEPKLENYHYFDLKKYETSLERVNDNLNEQGKDLIIELIAYRLLGFKKVKLSKNTSSYYKAMALGISLENINDTFDPHFMDLILKKVDLNPIDCNLKFYFSGPGVATDFILEQYAYKLNGKRLIEVEKGDTVIDAGACWGDTALYFAHKTGETGKVYSFDFIPDNMKLFKMNTSLNPEYEKIIELVPHPVSDKTGNQIYFKDNGPASQVEFSPFNGQTGSTTTITIDDFVKINNIPKVDFIKMDIEGAEPAALRGALETIKRFKPKLAITNYHGIDDFVNIPNWISDLGLDYEIFIDHFTIHAEETVCFAKPKIR
jgi:FkbM family methyltransferase